MYHTESYETTTPLRKIRNHYPIVPAPLGIKPNTIKYQLQILLGVVIRLLVQLLLLVSSAEHRSSLVYHQPCRSASFLILAAAPEVLKVIRDTSDLAPPTPTITITTIILRQVAPSLLGLPPYRFTPYHSASMLLKSMNPCLAYTSTSKSNESLKTYQWMK